MLQHSGDDALTQPITRAEAERKFRGDLQSVNLKWSAVKKVLPDWADSALSSRSGALELTTFVARHFGLAVSKDGSLVKRTSIHAKFKTRANTDISEVEAARSIATSCARIIAKTYSSKHPTFGSNRRLSDSAHDIRSAALRFGSRRWVDFESLLEVCWEGGVPVLYLPELPTDGKKMDGMVTRVEGRPVIIITKKAKPDWALFILAHEIGHIAKEHLGLNDGEAILDETILNGEAQDQQEREANEFASEILTPDGRGIHMITALKAESFASAALKYGSEHGISPGHVILNAAKHTKIGGKSLFSLGNAALNCLPPEAISRPTDDLCREAIQRHVNLDCIKDDSIEFLEKLLVV